MMIDGKCEVATSETGTVNWYCTDYMGSAVHLCSLQYSGNLGQGSSITSLMETIGAHEVMSVSVS